MSRSFNMLGKDGAQAGEYAVTVVWPTDELNGGGEIETGDLLKGCYSDPQNAAARVTIREGLNELQPFELPAT